MTPNQPYVKQLDPNDKTVILNPITINNPYFNNGTNRSKIRASYRYITLNGLKLKVGGNNRKPCKRTGKSRVEHLLN